MEGFTELLAGNIISKMISEGFISPFYSDCFSPAEVSLNYRIMMVFALARCLLLMPLNCSE